MSVRSMYICTLKSMSLRVYPSLFLFSCGVSATFASLVHSRDSTLQDEIFWRISASALGLSGVFLSFLGINLFAQDELCGVIGDRRWQLRFTIRFMVVLVFLISGTVLSISFLCLDPVLKSDYSLLERTGITINSTFTQLPFKFRSIWYGMFHFIYFVLRRLP